MHVCTDRPCGLWRLPCRSLLSRNQLLPFLADFLVPGAIEDDILLEVGCCMGAWVHGCM
jgi:hypothetical protein